MNKKNTQLLNPYRCLYNYKFYSRIMITGKKLYIRPWGMSFKKKFSINFIYKNLFLLIQHLLVTHKQNLKTIIKKSGNMPVVVLITQINIEIRSWLHLINKIFSFSFFILNRNHNGKTIKRYMQSYKKIFLYQKFRKRKWFSIHNLRAMYAPKVYIALSCYVNPATALLLLNPLPLFSLSLLSPSPSGTKVAGFTKGLRGRGRTKVRGTGLYNNRGLYNNKGLHICPFPKGTKRKGKIRGNRGGIKEEGDQSCWVYKGHSPLLLFPLYSLKPATLKRENYAPIPLWGDQKKRAYIMIKGKGEERENKIRRGLKGHNKGKLLYNRGIHNNKKRIVLNKKKQNLLKKNMNYTKICFNDLLYLSNRVNCECNILAYKKKLLCFKLNVFLYKLLWVWARKRHNKRSNRWIFEKYWKFKQNKPSFFAIDTFFMYYILHY